MKPTASSVHVNRPLTNMSIAYIQDARNFIASEAAPVIPVNNQSDRYFVYKAADFHRDEMQKRAPATESAGGGYEIDSTPNYFADVWAYHKDIDDQIRSNSDSPLSPDTDATEFVTQKALIRREKIFATNFLSTGVWTTDITGVASGPASGQVLRWSDNASDPIAHVNAGKSTILKASGFEPNRLIIGYEVWLALQNHPDVIDRVKYTQQIGANETVQVTEQALAYLFGVERVLVMRAVENTAKEGAAASNAFIGGKKALLCYTNPAPALMKPSAAYIFSWTGYTGAGPDGNRVSRFRMDHLRADRVEIEMAFDMKKVAADLGYLFDSIVA